MVILSRGAPITVQEKDKRVHSAISLSETDRERFGAAASGAGLKFSQWMRLAGDEKIEREQVAASLAVTLYVCPLGHLVSPFPGKCLECGGELWERRYIPEAAK